MQTPVYIALITVFLCLTHAKTAQECQNAYKQCDKHLENIFDVSQTHTDEEYCSAKIGYNQCMDGPTTAGCADKDRVKRVVQIYGLACGSSGLSGSVRVLIVSMVSIVVGVLLY